MFEFEKNECVIKISPDLEKSKSLFNTSKRTLKFAEKNILDKETAGILLGNYYESLIEILHSHSYKKGFKILDHKTFVEYIAEVFASKTYSELFDKYRRIRNNIIYYGKLTELGIAKQGIKDIKEIIKFIEDNFEK